MDIQPYSNREIDYRFDEVVKHLEKQDVTLERIEGQTTKTNGRVTRLEDWSSDVKAIIESQTTVLNDFKKTKWRMYGAISMLVFVGTAVAGGSILLIKYFINDHIDKKWAAIEDKYDIKVINN